MKYLKSFAFCYSLFEEHPEFMESFNLFRGIPQKDMKYSVVLRDHALRVMGVVEKCINRLEDPEKLKDLLLVLGKKHAEFKVQKRFIDVSTVGTKVVLVTMVTWTVLLRSEVTEW